jgi:hypothetical protein
LICEKRKRWVHADVRRWKNADGRRKSAEISEKKSGKYFTQIFADKNTERCGKLTLSARNKSALICEKRNR